jgi:hypothetical protein
MAIRSFTFVIVRFAFAPKGEGEVEVNIFKLKSYEKDRCYKGCDPYLVCAIEQSG